MTISSEEAQQLAVGIATAMILGDKEAREQIYADLTVEDLQKVLRWTTRWLISHMQIVCAMQGMDFDTAWQAFCMSITISDVFGE